MQSETFKKIKANILESIVLAFTDINQQIFLYTYSSDTQEVFRVA